MKRLFLLIVLACCTLALSAQDGIRVNYKGDRPTISDFATALFTVVADDEEDCDMDESFNAIQQAWNRHLKGLPLDEGETLTVDQKNGFILYESRYEESLVRIEMCYWNESDQKHKLVAYNVSCFLDGKYSAGQYDGLRFYRYDNAKKEMEWCDDTGFEVEYTAEGGAWVYYDLPRSGKDITVYYCYDDGRKKPATLKWGGRRFSKVEK